MYDPTKPPVGDNVNTGNLLTLASPYPQLVSGTPKSWSFTNGTFTFGYSTAKVDGSGTFAEGALTTISVPAVEFPNGYQVTVTGGHVVSADNAAQLVVASDSGATTVNVVVSPARKRRASPADTRQHHPGGIVGVANGVEPLQVRPEVPLERVAAFGVVDVAPTDADPSAWCAAVSQSAAASERASVYH